MMKAKPLKLGPKKLKYLYLVEDKIFNIFLKLIQG